MKHVWSALMHVWLTLMHVLLLHEICDAYIVVADDGSLVCAYELS